MQFYLVMVLRVLKQEQANLVKQDRLHLVLFLVLQDLEHYLYYILLRSIHHHHPHLRFQVQELSVFHQDFLALMEMQNRQWCFDLNSYYLHHHQNHQVVH